MNIDPNAEIRLRERFDLATRDVPTGPDLEVSISRGRTVRRRRRAGLAGGTAAGVAAAAVVAGLALSGGSGTEGSELVATDPTPTATGSPTTAPAPDDGSFVSGSDHDELLQHTIARHLPSLPRPDDIYPSDWDHAGPMPDADFADATDWQATYAVNPSEDLMVFTGYSPPNENRIEGCPEEDPATDKSPCVRVQAPGGGWITDDGYMNDGVYEFFSIYEAPSGFTAVAHETITADSWQQALDRRAFTPDDLHPLITDDALAFPLPASRR